VSKVPLIDPDEILRHIVECPDLYAAGWDPDSMDLKNQLLDMKLTAHANKAKAPAEKEPVPA